MLEPHRIAPDTVLVPRLVPAADGFGFVNTMVITGREPVLVDTGSDVHRDQWLEDVFSVVEPADVRWIFISHDDPDHVGNLTTTLDLCPRATLVTGRLRHPPLDPRRRVRHIRADESFPAGDRTLTAIRPPFYDAPATLGLYDTRTGVYWAADCFGAVVPHPTADAADLPAEEHLESVDRFATALSPWRAWLDPVVFGGYVDRLAAMELTALATAHGPTITDRRIGPAFDVLR
uniref:MBL fold metallo-hydrolase n=1 Tax=Herbidospora sakaeratensis TaxID=564415 RepID=UPI0007810E3F|nr:MBL fold metallo-hydrolase [Herbidospora sakaeratensis]